MRQVPRYAIIGNGRMASHLIHYFNLLNIDYVQWSRSQDTLASLYNTLANATHALILITDDAIDDFINALITKQHPHLLVIHFSGALVSNIAYSAHPLQTFTNDRFYILKDYQKIPFILEQSGPRFHEFFPDLINPYYYINTQDKSYYHAICVLANNISTLLWQKFYQEMQHRFQISPQDLTPFLEKTFQNIKKDSTTALTGPFSRKDTQTLQHNLSALADDPFHAIFKTMVEQLDNGALQNENNL